MVSQHTAGTQAQDRLNGQKHQEGADAAAAEPRGRAARPTGEEVPFASRQVQSNKLVNFSAEDLEGLA